LRLHAKGTSQIVDLILALTPEKRQVNGASWLVNEHRDLVDAAYVINLTPAALSSTTPAGCRRCQATEKVYADYQSLRFNPGGHSSAHARQRHLRANRRARQTRPLHIPV